MPGNLQKIAEEPSMITHWLLKTIDLHRLLLKNYYVTKLLITKRSIWSFITV